MKVVRTNHRQVVPQRRNALHCQDSARPSSLPTRELVRSIRPLLKLSLLGGVSLYFGNQQITIENRKANALVAYLAIAPGMKESRQRLAGLLWSETEDARALASLRQSLHVVRRAFNDAGVAGLSADKLHVRLDRSTLITDLDDAAGSIDRGQPTDALMNEMRITDDLLSGYDDIDPSFSQWLRVKRESVRQRFIRGLETQLLNPLLPTEVIKRVARAILNLDPTHEVACQKLMCAFVDSGNIVSALAAYKQLWDCLEEEHDIEPSAATQDIVVAIKTGAYAPPINASIDSSIVAASQGLCPRTRVINQWAQLRLLPGHPCRL